MNRTFLLIPVRDPLATRRLAKCALIATSALTLAACAALKADQAPACHGARRPANPFGSVLAPSSEPATTRPLASSPAGCGGRPA